MPVWATGSSRAPAVLELSRSATSAATAAPIAPVPAAPVAIAAPPPPEVDVDALTRRVLDQFERRLQIERERRGR
jgi:hypothetical protein